MLGASRQRKRPESEDVSRDEVLRVTQLAQARGWTLEPALEGTYVLRDERGTLQAADWIREGFGLDLGRDREGAERGELKRVPFARTDRIKAATRPTTGGGVG